MGDHTVANVNAEIYRRRVERHHERGDYGALFRADDGEFVRKATKEDYEAAAAAAIAHLDPDALVEIPGVGLCELREYIAFPGRD